MKQFPRIYSISTVGLIFHYNIDYILHPFRTDFNGESGIGKSMIADLLQLIFVAKRGVKFYKPGTESSGTEGRDTNTLPLDSLGYAFVNIQKSERQFLTIGVYIQRSTGNITPFIIQKGIQWEKNSIFEYHDKILLYENFLTSDRQIPEIEFLKRTILGPKGFILETFFNDAPRYHQLLFRNRILPMDLSQDEDKLITYAQIIQSFARAKSLNLKTNEFKNFLFSDDEDIHEEYKKQINALEGYQRQYVDQRNTIDKIELRFEVLKEYKNAAIRKAKAHYLYLAAKAAFDFAKYESAKDEHAKSKKKLTENRLKIEYYYLSSEQQSFSILTRDKIRVDDLLHRYKNDVDNADFELAHIRVKRAEYKEQLLALDALNSNYGQINKGLNEMSQLIARYPGISEIETAIKESPAKSYDKHRLSLFIKNLNDDKLLEQFERAGFLELDYDDSYSKQLKKIESITQEIKELEDLIKAYSAEDPSSIMRWIIDQGERCFSLEEESLLRHFIHLSTKEPLQGAIQRYIPFPSEMLAKLKIVKQNSNSVWINLDGVMEEIIIVKEAAFSHGASISINMQSVISSYKEYLSLKNEEKSKLTCLNKGITGAGWSPEILSLYRKKDIVLQFEEDDSLPTSLQFQEMKEWYSQKEYHTKQFENISKRLEAVREADSVLRVTEARHETAKETSNRSLTEAQERSERVIRDLHSKERDIETRRERINGIRIDEFVIDEVFLASIQGMIALNLKRFVENGVINTEKLQEEEIMPLASENGVLGEKIRILEDLYHLEGIELLKEKYFTSRDEFYKHMRREFDPQEHHRQHTQESVQKCLSAYNQISSELNELHRGRIQSLSPDNETIKMSQDVETIARELLPKVFEGKAVVDFESNLESEVTGFLRSINESMKDIDDHKERLVLSIFTKVSSVYGDYENKIKDIKKFFEEKEITGGMKVKLDFRPSINYPIEWIAALKRKVNAKSVNLTPLYYKDSTDDATAEEIIIRTFKEYSQSKLKDPEIKKLTNPKSYFDLEVSLVRPSGEKSDGSSGQDYAKIALLCIARLSRIERDKRQKNQSNIEGIRFMPIDEVAGLGGNFNVLYQIAQEYDYQIITMTISPDLILEEGKQYVYILNSNKESNEIKINMPPFGLFSNSDLQKNVAAFIKAKANEEKVNLEGN